MRTKAASASLPGSAAGSEPTHRGTKRPSEGADILAFRGVRCRVLSLLSLQKQREGLNNRQFPVLVLIKQK